MLMALSSMTVLAQDNNNGKGKFKDVPDNHWAKEYIDLMSQLEIINGYDNGEFRPNNNVSKAEFAKMMVLTLDLNLENPSTPYFTDVAKNDWEYKYVETAKPYMTFWETSLGRQFRPDTISVREDMAVAIVRGLGLNVNDTDLSVLNGYTDQNDISTNLRAYVATAINEGIMIGNNNQFDPQGNLSRAEAATLLARLLVEEKVVFDEGVKTVIDDFVESSNTPTLSANVRASDVKLEWSKVNADKFKYYKVAISEDNDNPNYPNIGSFVPLSGATNTAYELENGMSHGGLVLKGGESYYVAITAVFESGKYTSNVVEVTIPGEYEEPNESDRTPELEFEVREEYGDVVLEWSEVASQGFKYFKVVASFDDPSPIYPEDGYFKATSDTRWELTTGDSNNKGLTLEGGKTYYVAITAVYGDGKYSSNVVQITMPGEYVAPSASDLTPTLSYDVETNGVKLNWTQVPGSGFKYYKVVLSQTKENPYYPDYGYLKYISNVAETSFFVQEGQGYNDGSKGGIGGVVEDEGYYMTITAVYNSGKYTSNSVWVTVPDK
jgi:hypothetical protein